jgi:hypothetical protein
VERQHAGGSVPSKQRPPKTCYMCDALRTSSEHVPPRCLFPETESFGRDVRKNLITVPSCDIHNGEKSTDDEFFRHVLIAVTTGENQAATHVFERKIKPAPVEQKLALRSFFKLHGKVGGTGKGILQLDRPRFDRCADHIARALFFHTFEEKWFFPIFFISPQFYGKDENGAPVMPPLYVHAAAVTKASLESEKWLGQNPEVFKYRFKYEREAKSKAFAFECAFFELFSLYGFSTERFAQHIAGPPSPTQRREPNDPT